MTGRALASTASWAPQYAPARVLVGLLFAVVPLTVSFTGFDKFRAPKDIVSVVGIVVLALVCLAIPSFRIRIGVFEWGVLAGISYVVVHSLILKVLSETVVTVSLFALWLLLLCNLMSWEFQKKVWLLAGLAAGVNAVINVFEYFGKFPWMFREGGKELSGRLTPAGFFGEVGSGALVFGLVVLVSVFFLIHARNVKQRMLWMLICACNLVGLLFTRTLTASLALAACLLLWVAFHHWWVFKRNRQSLRWLGLFWILFAVATTGSIVIASQSELWKRFRQVADQVASGNLEVATAGRYAVFQITWEMIQEKPFLGRGLGTFGSEFFHQRADTPEGQAVFMLPQAGAFRQAHNEYLQVWAELGIAGLLFLLFLLAFPIYRGVRLTAREPDPERCYWVGLLTLTVLYFAISSLTIFPLHLSVTALLLTMILASLRFLDVHGFEPAVVGSGSRRTRGPLAILSLVLALPFFFGQYLKWHVNNEMGVAAFLMERLQAGHYNGRQIRTVATRVLSTLRDAEAQYDGFPEIYSLQGSAAIFLGRNQLAEESFRRAAAEIPSPETMTNLAAALIAQGKCDEADQYLDSALRYNSVFNPARQALRHCRDQRE